MPLLKEIECHQSYESPIRCNLLRSSLDFCFAVRLELKYNVRPNKFINFSKHVECSIMLIRCRDFAEPRALLRQHSAGDYTVLPVTQDRGNSRAATGACKFNFTTFWEIMTDRPTRRPTTDMRGHREVTLSIIIAQQSR